ncbi:TMEM165/GDT1 family protein [bacterium BFN5]|nr:TMEM165/GDT1 family protein [bacterium BFN5]QJW48977.1 TMEM165/GDT1 family protein [bacterium BFN5]
MTAFLTSMVFVVLAEMGDKTQLLAMAFATRYRWQTVMWGVFAATVLNHLMAVFIGNYITQLIPMHYVHITAAASFILFGLWTIRGDELNGEDKMTKYSPFWTVAIAFFMAEMGDKTQLATIALAAQFNTIVPVWLGTTVGMLIADAIGIIIGIVLGKKIPERAVKWFAALIFLFFGLWGLYEALPATLLTPPIISTSLIGLIILMCVISRKGAETN